MNKFQERYSLFWEIYEAPINWNKLEELTNLYQEVSQIVKRLTGVNLRVAPHTIIRLAQGPLSIQEIKEISFASIEYLIEGKLKKEFFCKTVKFERTEIFNQKNFIVCKDWRFEKNQIDIISAGVRGRRPSISKKSKVYGISKEEFHKLTNKEKKDLFIKMGL